MTVFGDPVDVEEVRCCQPSSTSGVGDDEPRGPRNRSTDRWWRRSPMPTVTDDDECWSRRPTSTVHTDDARWWWMRMVDGDDECWRWGRTMMMMLKIFTSRWRIIYKWIANWILLRN